jgi:hypothetical protein
MASANSTQIALFVALLFIIISSQPVYKITNAVFSKVGLRLADAAGNPTRAGLVVHALVMFAIVYTYATKV